MHTCTHIHAHTGAWLDLTERWVVELSKIWDSLWSFVLNTNTQKALGAVGYMRNRKFWDFPTS